MFKKINAALSYAGRQLAIISKPIEHTSSVFAVAMHDVLQETVEESLKLQAAMESSAEDREAHLKSVLGL